MSTTREALPRSFGTEPPRGVGLLVLVGILMVGIPLAVGVLVGIFVARESPGAAVIWSLAAAFVAFLAGAAGSLYIALGRAVAMLNEMEFDTREAAASARAAAERAHASATAKPPVPPPAPPPATPKK